MELNQFTRFSKKQINDFHKMDTTGPQKKTLQNRPTACTNTCLAGNSIDSTTTHISSLVACVNDSILNTVFGFRFTYRPTWNNGCLLYTSRCV